jgi:hypothetical protein
VQFQLQECSIDILKQGNLDGLFMFQSVQDNLGYNNKPGLAVFKQLKVSTSTIKKACKVTLQLLFVDWTFLNGYHFDQCVLLDVDDVDNVDNKNQILLPYTIVTS